MMDKIYRRSTQSNGTPRKRKNEKNRHRNTFMNFRVTPIERELIEARISMTGLTKAEFFIQSCLYQKILVKGNIRAFAEIKKAVDDITDTIEGEHGLSALTPDQAEKLRTVIEILDGMFK